MDSLADKILSSVDQDVPVEQIVKNLNALKSEIKHRLVPETTIPKIVEIVRHYSVSPYPSVKSATSVVHHHFDKRIRLQKDRVEEADRVLADLADLGPAFGDPASSISSISSRHGATPGQVTAHGNISTDLAHHGEKDPKTLSKPSTLRNPARPGLGSIAASQPTVQTGKIGTTAPGVGLSKDGKSATPMAVAEAPIVQDKRPSSANAAIKSSQASNMTASLPLSPSNAAETGGDHVTAVDIHSQKEFEEVVKEMLPWFEGNEGEDNWPSRQKHVIKLRGITHGNVPRDYHAAYVAAIRTLLTGILKAVNSLRTTVSTNGCKLIQDVASTIGPEIDPMMEVLLQSLIGLCRDTKKIAANNGNVTVLALLANAPYNVRSLNHIWNSCQEKNDQPRMFASGWLKTVISNHGHQKHVLEHHNGLKLCTQCITKGLEDANPKVRENMRATYWAFHKFFPEKAEECLSTLDARVKKGVENDSNNPNKPAPMPGPASRTQKNTFSKSTTAIAKRDELREQIVAKKKAAVAAKKQTARPTSTEASSRPVSSLASAPAPGLSSAPVRPVRGPKRPEIARPATADPYAIRKHAAAMTTPSMSPIISPGKPRSKTTTPAVTLPTKKVAKIGSKTTKPTNTQNVEEFPAFEDDTIPFTDTTLRVYEDATANPKIPPSPQLLTSKPALEELTINEPAILQPKSVADDHRNHPRKVSESGEKMSALKKPQLTAGTSTAVDRTSRGRKRADSSKKEAASQSVKPVSGATSSGRQRTDSGNSSKSAGSSGSDPVSSNTKVITRKRGNSDAEVKHPAWRCPGAATSRPSTAGNSSKSRSRNNSKSNTDSAAENGAKSRSRNNSGSGTNSATENGAKGHARNNSGTSTNSITEDGAKRHIRDKSASNTRSTAENVTKGHSRNNSASTNESGNSGNSNDPTTAPTGAIPVTHAPGIRRRSTSVRSSIGLQYPNSRPIFGRESSGERRSSIGERRSSIRNDQRVVVTTHTTTLSAEATKPENIESKPEIEAERKLESKPENKAKSKPETKAKSKPETKAKSKPATKVESKPESKPKTKVDNKVESKGEGKVESTIGPHQINASLDDAVIRIRDRMFDLRGFENLCALAKLPGFPWDMHQFDKITQVLLDDLVEPIDVSKLSVDLKPRRSWKEQVLDTLVTVFEVDQARGTGFAQRHYARALCAIICVYRYLDAAPHNEIQLENLCETFIKTADTHELLGNLLPILKGEVMKIYMFKGDEALAKTMKMALDFYRKTCLRAVKEGGAFSEEELGGVGEVVVGWEGKWDPEFRKISVELASGLRSGLPSGDFKSLLGEDQGRAEHLSWLLIQHDIPVDW